MSAVTTRIVARVGAVTLLAGALLVLSAPLAAAVTRRDGDQPGPGLSIGQTLLLFVGIPVAVFLLVALLIYAPSWAQGPRYRPGLSWWAAPVWFNGPDNPEAAVAAVEELHAGGGASARW